MRVGKARRLDMPYHFLEVAVTPSVRAAQADMGVEQIWLGDHDRPSDTFTANEIAFIASRDSFFVASVSETGWPYVQHRGGKAGFLKVLDERTMAFADYRGNRQYISVGNFAANDRACLFLMDYARRARLKNLWARGAPDARRGSRARRSGFRPDLQGKGGTDFQTSVGSIRLELPAAHHPTL